MSTHDKDKLEDLILKTVNRLRLIRADFADESDSVRKGYLGEELERALATVLPDQREIFLKSLLERFPTIGNDERTRTQEQQNEGDSSLKNKDFVIQRLLEIIPTLTEEQKVIIDRSLQEAGVNQGTGRGDSFDLPQELKTKLQINEQLNVNTADLADLSDILIEFVLKLEPLIWNTWRALSPRSSIRSRGSLAKKMGQLLCKDTEVTSDSVNEDLKTLQRLIAALTTAVSRAGEQFAKRHLAKFRPSEIASLVRMEPGSVFLSHEVKCWRKYVELAERLDEDAIDVEIKQAIVDYVESLAKGIAQ